MVTTPNRLQDHWDRARDFIQKEWPLLSPTAVRRINGDYDRFLKALKDTYHDFPLGEAIARDKLQRFFNSLDV